MGKLLDDIVKGTSLKESEGGNDYGFRMDENNIVYDNFGNHWDLNDWFSGVAEPYTSTGESSKSTRDMLVNTGIDEELEEQGVDVEDYAQALDSYCISVCPNYLKEENKEESNSLESLGITKAQLTKLVVRYLNDYAEALPEEAEEVSRDCYPNFGELDSYLNKYPEIMTALMNGGNDEFESIVQDAIDLWKEMNTED